jgi:hypothetical protein
MGTVLHLLAPRRKLVLGVASVAHLPSMLSPINKSWFEM